MFSPIILFLAALTFRESRACSPHITPRCGLEGQLYCPATGVCAPASRLCGGKCLESADLSVRPSMRFRDGEVECYEDACELECAYNGTQQEELFGAVYCEGCSQYCIMGKSCFGRCISTDEECEA